MIRRERFARRFPPDHRCWLADGGEAAANHGRVGFDFGPDQGLHAAPGRVGYAPCALAEIDHAHDGGGDGECAEREEADEACFELSGHLELDDGGDGEDEDLCIHL